VLCYGALQTKDAAAFLRHFVGLATEVVALPVRGEQVGRAPEDVAATARSLGLMAQAGSSAEDALQNLARREWKTPPRILIAGSLYLVGDVLAANGTPPE